MVTILREKLDNLVSGEVEHRPFTHVVGGIRLYYSEPALLSNLDRGQR